jgi:hypothetical protein
MPLMWWMPCSIMSGVISGTGSAHVSASMAASSRWPRTMRCGGSSSSRPSASAGSSMA